MNKDYTNNDGGRDFYREMPDYAFGAQRVTVSSPADPAEDTGIRLYCTQYKEAWGLQIRGFFRGRNYKKGTKWYIAHASLRVDELRALRDACDTALAVVEAKKTA